MDHAVARYDWGRWLCDCPNPACTNAMALTPGQATYTCRFQPEPGRWGGCGVSAPIDWPDNPDGITADLAHLPEAQQSWPLGEVE